MKRVIFLTLLNLLLTNLFGQLQDDFSDGNFNANPEWFGDVDVFTVTDQKLQLLNSDPSSSNISYLTVAAPTNLDANTTWEFWVQMDFSPSTSNFSRIYLSASNPDLSANQNGYYIKVGGISGSDDALELRRQDGDSDEVLISGMAGAVGNDPVLARVRVTRATTGEWELWADYTGGTDYQLQGTAIDATHASGNFFGVYCRYTSTRNDAFFFDDILIDPLFQDMDPPQMISATASSETEVIVNFSEPLNSGSATNTANYSINNSIGNPSNANLDAGNPSSVTLTLSTALTSMQTYELTIDNITDLAGNSSGGQSVSFTYIQAEEAEADDIIISEIMADPSPQVGLPNAEYIELYNRSDKAIQLGGFGVASGGTPEDIPDYLFLPGTYLIVTDANIAPTFTDFGSVVALTGFPALTNSGDGIRITDDSGNLIHEIEYSDSWYQDEDKRDGGWSLELIQTEGPYNCGNNWIASENPQGGTPGAENSVNGQTPDATLPDLLRATAESDFELLLYFSESLDPASALDPANYSVDNGLSVENVFVQPPNNDQVLVTLSAPIQTGIIYTITVNSEVKDCLGNPVGMMNSARFGLAEDIEVGDLIINEVLFNAETGGKDFIELYNRSDKILNVFGLEIFNRQKETGINSAFVSADHLVLPNDYVVLTSDPLDILDRYTVLNPGNLVENSLPTLEDKAGNVTISLDQVTLDSFDYAEDLHFGLLDNKNGVSLERLDPEAPTQSDANWHTAAATVGYATPTYKNSQFYENSSIADEIISYPSKTFSPDGDGFEDVFLINYSVDKPGYVLNLRIFDAKGRLVNHLINNQLLAAEGTFKWDGTTNEGSKARLGIYVLWIEIFQTDGTVEQSTGTCVVAGRLE
jgi:hypothetical protein